MVVKEEVWGCKRLQSLNRHPGVFNDGRMARIVDERNAIIRDFAAAERDGGRVARSVNACLLPAPRSNPLFP
jgi:hypothetical protein